MRAWPENGPHQDKDGGEGEKQQDGPWRAHGESLAVKSEKRKVKREGGRGYAGKGDLCQDLIVW
jgi:hypothetical protein